MKQILLAEDETNIRNNMTEILCLSGYSVITAAEGNEAIKLLREQTPDLIISDILMPHKDGVALYKEIKQDVRLRDIPFFFLSARSENADIIQELDITPYDIILKPVRMAILLDMVRRKMGAS